MLNKCEEESKCMWKNYFNTTVKFHKTVEDWSAAVFMVLLASSLFNAGLVEFILRKGTIYLHLSSLAFTEKIPCKRR